MKLLIDGNTGKVLTLPKEIVGEVAKKATQLGLSGYICEEDGMYYLIQKCPHFHVVFKGEPFYLYNVDLYGPINNDSFKEYSEKVIVCDAYKSLELVHEAIEEKIKSYPKPDAWVLVHREEIGKAFGKELTEFDCLFYSVYDTYEALEDDFPDIGREPYIELYRQVGDKHIFQM